MPPTAAVLIKLQAMIIAFPAKAAAVNAALFASLDQGV
jgi:hypothetical protein